jgi:hypothetical protein
MRLMAEWVDMRGGYTSQVSWRTTAIDQDTGKGVGFVKSERSPAARHISQIQGVSMKSLNMGMLLVLATAMLASPVSAAEDAKAKLFLVTTSAATFVAIYDSMGACTKARDSVEVGHDLISKGDPPGAVPYAVAMCISVVSKIEPK